MADGRVRPPVRDAFGARRRVGDEAEPPPHAPPLLPLRYDTFANRCLVSLYAALFGFSTAAHGLALARLALVVAVLSLALQALARPHARRGPREQAWRLASELFKLAAAVAANVVADGLGDDAGRAVVAAGLAAWGLGLALLCCPSLCSSKRADGCGGCMCRCGDYRFGVNSDAHISPLDDLGFNLSVR